MGKLDKEPRNTKGFLHGYQEWYTSYDVLICRGCASNGLAKGYLEWHQQAIYLIK
jgi:hypothetical protein